MVVERTAKTMEEYFWNGRRNRGGGGYKPEGGGVGVIRDATIAASADFLLPCLPLFV